MMESLASAFSEIGSKLAETAKSAFDPDSRVEKSSASETKGLSDSKESKSYDPDAKVEKGETSKSGTDGEKPYDPDAKVEKAEPIQNKIDGLRRENEVESELKEKYPEKDGYNIQSEAYLRDKDGKIVQDPVTGEARRIDFVVVKDGKVVDSVEVTSKTADKTGQMEKENRIRENGGNYIRDNDWNLVRIPDSVQTRIERRD